jgi:hypothetical protein
VLEVACGTGIVTRHMRKTLASDVLLTALPFGDASFGALLQQRGASIDEVIDKLAAAFVRIGGDKPFRSTSQAIIIQARAI